MLMRLVVMGRRLAWALVADAIWYAREAVRMVADSAPTLKDTQDQVRRLEDEVAALKQEQARLRGLVTPSPMQRWGEPKPDQDVKIT